MSLGGTIGGLTGALGGGTVGLLLGLVAQKMNSSRGNSILVPRSNNVLLHSGLGAAAGGIAGSLVGSAVGGVGGYQAAGKILGPPKGKTPPNDKDQQKQAMIKGASLILQRKALVKGAAVLLQQREAQIMDNLSLAVAQLSNKK